MRWKYFFLPQFFLEGIGSREKDSLGRTVNQSWATNKTITKDWVSPLISALPERAAFLFPVPN